MSAAQAGALAVIFLVATLVALFGPPFNPGPLRLLLARWLLIAALVSAATCSLIQGCAEPPRRVPVELLMDSLPPPPANPCPGGRLDPSQEFGCAFPDSMG